MEEMQHHCRLGSVNIHTGIHLYFCRVEESLTSHGWMKLEDKSSLKFTLKWVEVKQHIDYKSFREGEQIVNHFPNIHLLTTKIGLLESLRMYCKLHR